MQHSKWSSISKHDKMSWEKISRSKNYSKPKMSAEKKFITNNLRRSNAIFNKNCKYE